MKRKAIIAGILAVLLILCALPFAAAQTRGDADGDGKVTAADARLILRAAVGLEEIKAGSATYTACDLDSDGKLTAADARTALRIAVGLETIPDRTLPIEPITDPFTPITDPSDPIPVPVPIDPKPQPVTDDVPGRVASLSEAAYVVNMNTMKFHSPRCSSVAKITDKNKAYSAADRSALVAAGYSPCGICKP